MYPVPATAAAVESAERSPGAMGMDLKVTTKYSATPMPKRMKERTAGAAPRRWNRKNSPPSSALTRDHSSRRQSGYIQPRLWFEGDLERKGGEDAREHDGERARDRGAPQRRPDRRGETRDGSGLVRVGVERAAVGLIAGGAVGAEREALGATLGRGEPGVDAGAHLVSTRGRAGMPRSPPR